MSDKANEIGHSESQLAEILGVSRDVLAELRKKLAEGDDWTKGAHGAIYYTTAGEEKALAALAAPKPENDAASGDSAQPQASTLIVIRKARLNRKLIFAREKEAAPGSAEVPVRVRDANLFTPGQEISAVSQGGYWTLFGKQPRGGRMILRRHQQ